MYAEGMYPMAVVQQQVIAVLCPVHIENGMFAQRRPRPVKLHPSCILRLHKHPDWVLHKHYLGSSGKLWAQCRPVMGPLAAAPMPRPIPHLLCAQQGSLYSAEHGSVAGLWSPTEQA